MDLGAITPGDAEQSVDASLRWLANQSNGRWMLFFDNADDVHLNLNTFFPPSTSGNILITTRNRELRHYATNESDQNVTGMEHGDATKLLLDLSQAEETDENRLLAAQIVQVCFLSFRVLGMKPRNRRRNSITSLWQSPKQVPSFTAIHHYATIASSFVVNATICFRIEKLRIRTHTNQQYMRRGD